MEQFKVSRGTKEKENKMHIEIRVHEYQEGEECHSHQIQHWDLPIEGSSEDECLPFIEKAMRRVAREDSFALLYEVGTKIAFVTPYLIESEEFLPDGPAYLSRAFISIRIKDGQLSARSVKNLAQINS